MTLVSLAITLFCIILLVVSFSEPLAQRLGLPPPVIIGGIGAVAGTVAALFGFEKLGFGLDGYDRWLFGALALDAQSILLVFMPPLLFEMALGVNARRALEDGAAIAVLAVVAVVAATLLVGFGLHQFSSLGLVASLLVGAAISTTDPSAVISTFRRIGAPKRLTMLLEGESLLNDAAAIALFGLFLVWLRAAESISPSAIVLAFLYDLGVGAVVGILLALVAAQVFSWLDRSAVAEASVTVALAYGAFLMAERVLGASGVVAVVFAGVTTAWVGQLQMGPRNWSSVQAVWTQIGFWANALVLIVASVSVPAMIGGLKAGEILLIGVVFVAAFLARAAILAGVLPLLSITGLAAPIGWRQKTLIWWGGVRGAVTLVLAMSLGEVSALGDKAGTTAAIAAGFALLTLLLNASTLALLTRRFGLDRLSPADVALRAQVIDGTHRDISSHLAELGAARGMDVQSIREAEERFGALHGKPAGVLGMARIAFGDRLKLGLAILAAQERRAVRSGFEAGTIGPRSARILLLTADRLADAARLRGRDGYEVATARAMEPGRAVSVATRLARLTGWEWPLRRILARHVLVLLETEAIQRQLSAFAATSLSRMIGTDAAENLIALGEQRLSALADRIEAIRLQYPRYVRDIEVILLLRAGLREERHRYDSLLSEGIIGQEITRGLFAGIEERHAHLERMPPLDLRISTGELLAHVPLFRSLDGGQRARIAKILRPRFAIPGEMLARRGERGSAMVFIASGAIEVRGAGAPVRLATGGFFGEVALLAPGRKRETEIISLGYSRLLVLRRRDYLRLIRNEPEIGNRIALAAREQLQTGFRLDTLSGAAPRGTAEQNLECAEPA